MFLHTLLSIIYLLAPTNGDPTDAPTYLTDAPTPTSLPPKTVPPSVAPTAGVPPPMTTNKGREFVLGFMRNIDRTFGTKPSDWSLTLLVTGDKNGTGTVSVPGEGFNMNFEVVPGTVSSLFVPHDAAAENRDAIEKGGIRVTSSTDISVYGFSYEFSSTDAYLGLPIKSLGTHYIAVGYLSVDFAFLLDKSYYPRLRFSSIEGASAMVVVAAYDNTYVTITPSVSTADKIKNVPYVVKLDALDTYQLLTDEEATDITGTIIESSLPVSVYSGSSCSNVPNSTRFCDHLVEQMIPTSAWGTEFYAVPIAGTSTGALFRVMASENNTDVIIDDVLVATLTFTDENPTSSSRFYEADLNTTVPHEILTTKPALTVVYNKGGGRALETDPFQVILQATEHYLSSYTITTPDPLPGGAESPTRYTNVVVQSDDIDECTVDGAPMSDFYTSLGALVIGTSEYSAAQLAVPGGALSLDCPSPFGAYAYDTRNVGSLSFQLSRADIASWGYPLGMSLPDTSLPQTPSPSLAPSLSVMPTTSAPSTEESRAPTELGARQITTTLFCRHDGCSASTIIDTSKIDDVYVQSATLRLVAGGNLGNNRGNERRGLTIIVDRTYQGMCGDFFDFDDFFYYNGASDVQRCNYDEIYPCLDPIDVTEAVRKGSVEISMHANEAVQARCNFMGFRDVAGIVEATLDIVVVPL